jgi:hypothetical protein
VRRVRSGSRLERAALILGTLAAFYAIWLGIGLPGLPPTAAGASPAADGDLLVTPVAAGAVDQGPVATLLSSRRRNLVRAATAARRSISPSVVVAAPVTLRPRPGATPVSAPATAAVEASAAAAPPPAPVPAPPAPQAASAPAPSVAPAAPTAPPPAAPPVPPSPPDAPAVVDTVGADVQSTVHDTTTKVTNAARDVGSLVPPLPTVTTVTVPTLP